MRLEDLKVIWKREMLVMDSDKGFNEAMDKLVKQTSKMDKAIKFRDTVESMVALLLIPLWVFELFFDSNNVYSYFGWSVLILACLFIPYRLMLAKKVVFNKLNSVRLFLETEIEKTYRQINLLKSLFWWYLGPIAFGGFFATLGSRVNMAGELHIDQDLLIYYGLCTIVMIGIYFLNQWYAEYKFKPVLEQLQGRLKQLTSIAG